MQLVDLSIILVNWNALELTSEALRSLRATTRGISYEVFVVENGSTRDASATELPRRFPWARFIVNPDNRGYSRANNQALRLATGRHVLLLNTDTVQIEDAISKAVRYLDLHPDVGALGIQHLNDDVERTCQRSFHPFPALGPQLLALLGGRGGATTEPPTRPPEQDVDWVCASFLMIRRECLSAVGELDERFFVYAEDVDWCLRAHRAGWKVRFWPGAAMVHKGAASAPFLRDKTFMHFRSHLTYLAKNHSTAGAVLYYLAMSLRLSAATAKHAAQFVIGRSNAEDLRARVQRQKQFMLLRSSRSGVGGLVKTSGPPARCR